VISRMFFEEWSRHFCKTTRSCDNILLSIEQTQKSTALNLPVLYRTCVFAGVKNEMTQKSCPWFFCLCFLRSGSRHFCKKTRSCENILLSIEQTQKSTALNLPVLYRTCVFADIKKEITQKSCPKFFLFMFFEESGLDTFERTRDHAKTFFSS
jgi:hypothetical protein